MPEKHKLIRIATVPMALAYPLQGQSSYMHQHGMDVTMISSDGREMKLLLQQENCPHIIVPMTRSITPFRDIKCIFQLIRIFKKLKPDIVHTETPKAGLVGMIAAKLCGVRVRIHTVAGLPLMVEKGVKLRILEWVEKITYAAATNVWPNSNSLKNFILQHRFTSAKKLLVVGKGSSNGIDIDRFSPEKLGTTILEEIKQNIQYNKDNVYLLFIGRLVLDKGIVELIHVFKKLHEKNPKLKLILAGHFERSLDPLPQDVEIQIAENKNIIHINWTDKVPYYLALSNIFVFPSYREGFPNVLLEAGAMKLPIVCSRIAGNVDIVEDNITGRIFESQNENDLERVLTDALDNMEHMKEMASSLQQNILNNYCREVFWQTMLEEYKKLLICKK